MGGIHRRSYPGTIYMLSGNCFGEPSIVRSQLVFEQPSFFRNLPLDYREPMFLNLIEPEIVMENGMQFVARVRLLLQEKLDLRTGQSLPQQMRLTL